MSHKNKQTGFTLIELMISMTFIALLLIALASVIIYISNLYTKGVTLREVNQIGRTVSDDLQKNIAESPPIPLSNFDLKSGKQKGASSRYIPQTSAGNGGGRFCLGKYSYVWNTAVELRKGNSWRNTYDTGKPVVFAKVVDPDAQLCIYPNQAPVFKNSVEVLASGDRDLALHDLQITETPATDNSGDQSLYILSMIIGTNDPASLSGNVLSGTGSCKPPSEGRGLEYYCAVNKFEITARAGSNQ